MVVLLAKLNKASFIKACSQNFIILVCKMPCSKGDLISIVISFQVYIHGTD